MQKVLCSILFLYFLNLIGFAQTDRCDTIYWAEKTRIIWSNFQAIPDSASSFKAVSNPVTGYKAKNIDDTLMIDIYCRFINCKSWTKSDSKNLLKHEQTHFDIAEYFKRLFIQKVLSTHFTRQGWPVQVKDIFEENKKSKDSLDKKYDLETSFSTNKVKQDKWTADIRTKVGKLKSIDKKRIIIYLKD